MKKLILTLLALFSAVGAIHAQPTGFNTGMPFGLIGPKELDHLEAYAKKEGVDLMGDMKRAYQKDEEALGRVFAFSLKFKKLDRDAKAYGQMFLQQLPEFGRNLWRRAILPSCGRPAGSSQTAHPRFHLL